ncbi:MAG: succinate dehydrogenase, cytochrome b556 subunit [Bacteroidetes bacterium]|nr:succinate dehydrogenase, cytochrome b556 subunit [Bacteroidota bacterium]
MSNLTATSFFSRWLEVLFNYRKHTGSWAWILHRITGLGLTLYIMIHIIALTGLLKGETAFNEEMALFKSPIFLFGEWLLGALVMFHSLNGVRIALVDFGNGARFHKEILTFVYILGVLMVTGMAYLIFLH